MKQDRGHKVLITETESNVALEATSCMLDFFRWPSPVPELQII